MESSNAATKHMDFRKKIELGVTAWLHRNMVCQSFAVASQTHASTFSWHITS